VGEGGIASALIWRLEVHAQKVRSGLSNLEHHGKEIRRMENIARCVTGLANGEVQHAAISFKAALHKLSLKALLLKVSNSTYAGYEDSDSPRSCVPPNNSSSTSCGMSRTHASLQKQPCITTTTNTKS
jgi:hypothetical protein